MVNQVKGKVKKSKIQKKLDSISFELPLWLSKKTVYVILSVLFLLACFWAGSPFFQTVKIPPSGDKQDLHYEYYHTLNDCIAHHHSKLSCSQALEQIKKMTVSQLPMYEQFQACQSLWDYCINLNTGRPVNNPDGKDIIVSLPLIKGFKVAWDGESIKDVKPLFENANGVLSDADGNEETHSSNP